MAISKKAASVIANDLDRLATLFETECDTLGVPKKVAVDFAMRCDLLSDYLEKNASDDEDEDSDSDDDGEEKKEDEKKEESSDDEKEAGKKASLPEEDFTKDVVDSEVELQTETDEPYMDGAKEQTYLHELGDLEKSDSLENAAKLAQLVLRMQSEIRNAHSKSAKKEEEKEAGEHCADDEKESNEEKKSNEEKESSDEKEAKKAHSHGYNLNL